MLWKSVSNWQQRRTVDLSELLWHWSVSSKGGKLPRSTNKPPEHYTKLISIAKVMHAIICDEILQMWFWRQTKSLQSVNFEKFTSLIHISKLTDCNQIFRNDFACLHYHLCKISAQINECEIFSPNDFLQWTLYITLYVYSIGRCGVD